MIIEQGKRYITRGGQVVHINHIVRNKLRKFPVEGTVLRADMMSTWSTTWRIDGRYSRSVRDDMLDLISEFMQPASLQELFDLCHQVLQEAGQ